MTFPEAYAEAEPWIALALSRHRTRIMDSRDARTLCRTAIWHAWRRFKPHHGKKFRNFALLYMKAALIDESRFLQHALRSTVHATFYPEFAGLDGVKVSVPPPSDAPLEVHALMKRLSKRDQKVISLLYFSDLTHREASLRMGVSESCILQWRNRAFSRMRA